jgi:NADPH2:quinone reductase
MRGLICERWSELDDLRVGEMQTPAPSTGEVLIKVQLTAVNYADSIMVRGQYQTKPSFPFSPGLETAGEVVACGPEVTSLQPGDRVMAILAFGGLAEYAVAKAAETYRIPEGMSWSDAAAFPIAYLSSHVAIRWQGHLEAGETMLVLGAAGGVGLTAVEIGKAMGARVIAAASTPEKLEAARSRGADDIINYSEVELKKSVDDLTDGNGVNVVFDPVGGDLFDQALSSLGWGGRILLIGFVGGVPKIPANRLLVKHRSALGSSLRYYRWYEPDKLQRSVDELLTWYAHGKLHPMVTEFFSLEDSALAIRSLTERRAIGRVLVNVGETL